MKYIEVTQVVLFLLVYSYHSQKIVIIKKAFETIESQIDELPLYIKIAEQYCHFPSGYVLSQD